MEETRCPCPSIDECINKLWYIQATEYYSGSGGKASAYNVEDPWVGKISWRRQWQPTPAFLPGKSHGQRSLIGYSPWGCRESDTTECNFSAIRNMLKPWKDIQEPKMHIGKWKKTIWKGYIVYTLDYITFWKEEDYQNIKTLVVLIKTNISGCQEFGKGGRMNRQSTEDI